MQMIRKMTAVVLALCLLCVLGACGEKKNALDARFKVLYLSEFPTEYLEDPQTYQTEIDSFHLPDFAATFQDYQAFKTYNVEIAISNGNDYAVEVFDIQLPDKMQGKNGVYFSTLDDGSSLGIPANFTGEQTVYYQVVADASLSMDEVLQTLGKMKITCIYADASAGIEEYASGADNAALQQSVIRCTGK